MKDLSKNSRSHDRDLKSRTPHCEATALTFPNATSLRFFFTNLRKLIIYNYSKLCTSGGGVGGWENEWMSNISFIITTIELSRWVT